MALWDVRFGGKLLFGMHGFLSKYNCSRQKEKNSESTPCARACVGNYHLVFLQCSQSLDAFKKKQKKGIESYRLHYALLAKVLFSQGQIAIFLSIIACIIPRQLVDYHDCVSLNC